MTFAIDPRAVRAALAGGPAWRVTVAATRGSAPREAGASMIVTPDGQDGTIGGGALEWEAARRARAHRGGPAAWRQPLGPGLGQCCGGAVTLVVEALEAVPDGPLRALRVEGDAPCPAAPGWRDGWLVERVAPPRPDLWIWGAGHVGRAVAAVLAPMGAWRILLADVPGKHPAPIPGAETVAAADLPALAAHADPAAQHLVLTHSHGIDLALCDALLRRGFAGAGLIGSDAKRARFARRLTAMGHPGLGAIRCPIGDRSLGKHPQALAVGVAAEMIGILGTSAAGAMDSAPAASQARPARPSDAA